MAQPNAQKHFRLINFLIRMTLILLVFAIIALLFLFVSLQWSYFFVDDFSKMVTQNHLFNRALNNNHLMLNTKLSVSLLSLVTVFSLTSSVLSFVIMKNIKKIFKVIQADSTAALDFNRIIKLQLILLIVSVLGTIVAGFLGSLEIEVAALFGQVALLAMTVIAQVQQEVAQ
jgi:hypothetical protein